MFVDPNNNKNEIERHLEVIQKETEKEKEKEKTNKDIRMTAEEQKKYFLEKNLENLIELNNANDKKFNSKKNKDEYYFDEKEKKLKKRPEIEELDKIIDNLNKDKNLDYKNFTKSNSDKTLAREIMKNPDKKSSDIIKNHNLKKGNANESKIKKIN
jgi:hypothetical protein